MPRVEISEKKLPRTVKVNYEKIKASYAGADFIYIEHYKDKVYVIERKYGLEFFLMMDSLSEYRATLVDIVELRRHHPSIHPYSFVYYNGNRYSVEEFLKHLDSDVKGKLVLRRTT